MTWMMRNPHTKLTRRCVFTRPKSCCSLAWNRRRGKTGLTSWHLRSTCPGLSSLATQHPSSHLPSLCSPALRGAMAAMCSTSWQAPLCCTAAVQASEQIRCFHSDLAVLKCLTVKLEHFKVFFSCSSLGRTHLPIASKLAITAKQTNSKLVSWTFHIKPVILYPPPVDRCEKTSFHCLFPHFNVVARSFWSFVQRSSNFWLFLHCIMEPVLSTLFAVLHYATCHTVLFSL